MPPCQERQEKKAPNFYYTCIHLKRRCLFQVSRWFSHYFHLIPTSSHTHIVTLFEWENHFNACAMYWRFFNEYSRPKRVEYNICICHARLYMRAYLICDTHTSTHTTYVHTSYHASYIHNQLDRQTNPKNILFVLSYT